MDKAITLNIYCLSGLGADERLFTHFEPEFGTVKPIQYIDPINKDESIQSYSLRLSNAIDDTVPFILVGISLGGIIATEIARIKEPIGIIFLSTIKSAQEKSYRFGFIRKIKGIFTFKWTQKHISWFRWYFYNNQEYLLFKSMLLDTSTFFGQWAIEQVINWKGSKVHLPYIHINGKKDELFPFALGKGVHLIPNKRHDMTLNSWTILNPMINQWLHKLLDKTSNK